MSEPVEEGMIKKGGQNPPVPTTGRPPAPQGSGGRRVADDVQFEGDSIAKCGYPGWPDA
jgi:hypothetical protein